jgi:hypothetical protein
MRLDELPPDLLLQICSPLDAVSLDSVARCGSRALRAAASDASLWRPLLRALHASLLQTDGIDPHCSLLPTVAFSEADGCGWRRAREENSSDIVWQRLYFSCRREWRSHRKEALSLQRQKVALQVLEERDAEIFGNGDGFEHAWREAIAGRGGGGGTMLNMTVLLQICMMSGSIQRLLWILVAVLGVVLAWAGACAVVGVHEVASFVRDSVSAYLAPWLSST